MIELDGITDANRGTWSRLTRLHSATAGLPPRRTPAPAPDHRDDSTTA